MTRLIIFCLTLILFQLNIRAQEKETFTIIKEIKHLPIVNQGSTGTCWSFATISFLESEIIRKGFPETDLSEIFIVNYTYKNKAEKYLLYHGNNNFSEGGQAHDVFDVIAEHGLSTEEAFPGEKIDGKFNHNELINELKIEVNKLNDKRNNFDVNDIKSFNPILKKHLGKLPKHIEFDDKKYSPKEFLNELEINPDDYVEISSYTHHPFYEPFVLEVPDNWSHGLYYNLPMDEMMEVIHYSLNTGYTVCWDGDTSEKTFRNKNGKADVPEKLIDKINQEMRQETFMNRTTTDDHLMHLVGLSEDDEGKTCFYTKNSWGAASNNYGGYLHLTEDYVRLKTIAIVVHKDAIPKNIRKKLNL
ncbi:MAG: aminopeptidase [Prolixibacteraceae bacterium]|nr:aminopeptidase [Prolixibacteraceae bacterium]